MNLHIYNSFYVTCCHPIWDLTSQDSCVKYSMNLELAVNLTSRCISNVHRLSYKLCMQYHNYYKKSSAGISIKRHVLIFCVSLRTSIRREYISYCRVVLWCTRKIPYNICTTGSRCRRHMYETGLGCGCSVLCNKSHVASVR